MIIGNVGQLLAVVLGDDELQGVSRLKRGWASIIQHDPY